MKRKKNIVKEKKTFAQKVPTILIASIAIVIVLFCTFFRKSNAATNSTFLATDDGESFYYPNQITTNAASPELNMSNSSQKNAAINGDSTTENASDYASTEKSLLETSSGNEISRKITKSATLRAYSKEFDETIEKISILTKESGGYFASSSIYNNQYDSSARNADYTIMVPAENYEDFIASLGEVSVITQQSETSDDLTSAYVDIEARLTSLRAQEKRLLELMETAQSMEDILTIQAQLTNVQYEIENYVSSQRTFDNMISYSTISLALSERSSSGSPTITYTFWDQVKEAISNTLENSITFLQDLAIGFIYAIPLLILLTIVVILLYFIKKLVQKKIAQRPQSKNNKNSISEPPTHEMKPEPDSAEKIK